MEEIRNLLKEREKYLRGLKSEKEKELKAAPEGLLRVCNSRNRIQYYHRTNPKDFNGVYIKEKKFIWRRDWRRKPMIKEFLGQLKKSWNVLRNILQTTRKEMWNKYLNVFIKNVKG